MVLFSWFFNLLVNGLGGIVVGMVINILLYNLCELVDVVFWVLENYDVDEEEILVVVMGWVKGLDFLIVGLIVGFQGIVDVYKIGCGFI